MIVFSRQEWGAQYGLGPEDPGPEEMVVIHHSASPLLLPGASLRLEREAIQSIERYHVVTNGWAAIGYNWMVTPNGHIYEGRGWFRAGAHAGSRADNFRSIGICYVANGDTQHLTPAAVEAIHWLMAEGRAEGHLDPDHTVVGHRDLKATACPGGAVYDQVPELRRRSP